MMHLSRADEYAIFQIEARNGKPQQFLIYWMQRLKWPALCELLRLHNIYIGS